MLFTEKFYDEVWNFDNTKFLKLLENAKKRRLKENKKRKKSSEIILFWRVSKREVWQFINRLSIFINSWLDIKSSLWILLKQTKNPYFKKIIIEMKENVNSWILIHESMAKYPKVFDQLVVSLVWVWENTGLLWKILKDLDRNLLEKLELRSKIKWAMIYPMILFLLTVAMVIFMMTFIIPKITWAFISQWVKIPTLTQIIIDISNFIRNDYLIILWVLVFIFIILKLINKTYSWKLFFAKIAMRLPVFGYIVKQSNILYFIKSFSALLDAGVLLLESIKTSSQVVPNLAYKKELIRIKNEVEFWLTISKAIWLNNEYEESIYLNKYFPEEFAYVINTWEETGTLSDSMTQIWKNYNNELKRYISNMSTMIEPFIIVVVWFLVWTIVIAIMLPFFEMWKVIKNL